MLARGVMPWCTGETGNDGGGASNDLLGSMYTNPGAVDLSALSHRPFSALSSEFRLFLSTIELVGVKDIVQAHD